MSCSFCGRMSPERGAVVTGLSREVICEHCMRDVYAMIVGTPTSGLPPDDIDAAEAEIRAAFEHMMQAGENGNDLVNVEGGEGLGRCMREGPRHYEGVTAKFSVSRIRFLDMDEAEAFFTIEAMGNQFPYTGRAVLVGDRWLVSRETAAQVLHGAGIHVPPSG